MKIINFLINPRKHFGTYVLFLFLLFSEILYAQNDIVVNGIVVSNIGQVPIDGATVSVKGTKRTTLTKEKGKFSIVVPESKVTLIISYVGYRSKELHLSKSENNLLIELLEDSESIEDVVVTGIFTRKKESFTGSSATYSIKDLKAVGNQNLLQSLKTLDPSFAIIENNLYGSDPNRTPEIEIRGKSSVIGLTQEYGVNPNQPLFILDGFETTLSVINDMSMDRVESITILKDAASTAIYGSRAANGVVVVETKRPTPGKLRLSYNLNTSFNFADLSDYNLMNAAEKLEFERLSTFYGSIDVNGNILNEAGDLKYYNRLKEVQRGVDSYWLNEPLQFAPTQAHAVYLDGGDENFQYGASLSYGNNRGVMKGSSRELTSGNVRLNYRKGKLSFSNSLSIDLVNANTEPFSFSNFSRANPYHRKWNEEGEVDKVVESYNYYDNESNTRIYDRIYNPLYNSQNKNVNVNKSQAFTNNFEIDWRVLNELRIRTRVGVNRLAGYTEIFRSPFNTEFEGVDFIRQGQYSENNENKLNYDGDFSVTYGKLLNKKYTVNAVVGSRLNQSNSLLSGNQVFGFTDEDFINPAFAYGYLEGSRPVFRQTDRRGVSFFFNSGYGYDNRYLIDATLRSEGSSVFGSTKQFTNIWSVGLAWNLHNESFIKNGGGGWIDMLKLRGSIGTPGNQNFNDNISTRIYSYNNSNRNPFGSSVIIENFGNSELKWQKTVDRNIGVDFETMNRRLRLTVDYFYKSTDPLLIQVIMPSSAGSTTLAQNFGGQITKGATLIASYSIIRNKDLTWNMNVNARHLKSRYTDIGNSLDHFNSENKSRNLVRYYDGGSPSDLWAVRSLGIDPATGREVFLNSNDEQTFVHNFDDERVVGNSTPDLDGIIGTSLLYKGFSASLQFRYRLGGQIFMQTLYEKVENISHARITYNQDKRALYDRWQQPGDQAKFKAISLTENTPISSRFVEDNNIIAGESISLGYETTKAKWLRSIGASSIRIKGYMNDIFQYSSIQNERGIDYPFARSISFSLGVTF